MQKFKEEERWIRAEADRLAREEQIRKDTAKQQKRREKGTNNILHHSITYLRRFRSLIQGYKSDALLTNFLFKFSKIYSYDIILI